jgi:hypothetical protein
VRPAPRYASGSSAFLVSKGEEEVKGGDYIADEVVPGLVSRRAHRTCGSNAGAATASGTAASAARRGQEEMGMMTETANHICHFPASASATVLCLLLRLSLLLLLLEAGRSLRTLLMTMTFRLFSVAAGAVDAADAAWLLALMLVAP